MFCKKCGRSLTENDKFCLDCGTPVDQMEEKIVFAQAEAPAPVKKSKAKLLVPVVAVVAVVGIVAALLLSGVFADPTAKLAKAITNSVAAWNEASVLDAEDLAWLVETREEYSGEYQLWLEDFPEVVQMEGFGLRADFNYSQPQRYFDMTLTPTFGYADIIHAKMVLKDNELYIGSQELTKDTYYMIHTDLLGQEMSALGVPGAEEMGFNLFDMAEKMQKSYLSGREVGLESAQKLVETAKAVQEQIQVEKTGSGEIDVNGANLKADTYHVLIPQSAVSAMLDAVESIGLAQNNLDTMMEMYADMGMDNNALLMMEEELKEAAAMQKESFAQVRKAIEAMGDLELDMYVSDKLVVAVEFSITYEEETVTVWIAIGGGENYVDNITVMAKDQEHEGFVLVSEGDHGAKSGTFTDKTTITLTADATEVLSWELRYAPDGQSNNLFWKINVEDAAIEMNGQLTLGAEEFFLRLDELTVDDGYTVGSYGVEYRFGKYNPQTVDTSNHLVLAEMTDADMTATSNSLMMNAMEWLTWLQENFPEMVSMLMY